MQPREPLPPRRPDDYPEFTDPRVAPGYPPERAERPDPLQRAERFEPDPRDADYRPAPGPGYETTDVARTDLPEQTIELREEELVADREMREVGEVRVRTRVEEFPGRLEVDAYSEEVEVEHVPMGQVVSERRGPWEDGDVLVVPVYEEQLVVSRRLMLREQIRIRRVGTQRRELFEDVLRRERVEVEDPRGTGMVHERFPTVGDDRADEPGVPRRSADGQPAEEGNFLEHLVRRAFQ